MKQLFPLLPAALAVMLAAPAAAQGRYGERPPLVVSPDLAAPWVMQLRRAPQGMPLRQAHRPAQRAVMTPAPQPRARHAGPQYRTLNRPPPAVRPDRSATTAALAAGTPARPAAPRIDPKFLPQMVDYAGPHKPGTIVVDTRQHMLYLVEAGGKARRYGVGTGKPGFQWAGSHKVTAKREWPDWRPPATMIERERKKGRILPVHMKGGPENPLGARALYLGSTLYRIHGTNQPHTIGGPVSSGCIRMRNEDVIDLYDRVKVGATVVVI